MMLDRLLPPNRKLDDDQVYNDYLLNCTAKMDAKSYLSQYIESYTKIVIQASVPVPLWENLRYECSRPQLLFTLEPKAISFHEDKIAFDYQIFNADSGVVTHHIEIEWHQISCVYEHTKFLETIIFFNSSDARHHFA